MNSEAELDDTQAGDVDQNDQQQVDQQQVDQTTTETPKGHMSKEDWEASGKDPGDWRSPEVFEERGKWLNQVKDLKDQAYKSKQDTDVQIRNLNQLHSLQLKNTIAELESKRNSAIDEADTAQANILQSQIDHHRQAQQYVEIQAQQPQQAEKSPEVADWEQRNAWINNPNDPKTPFAQQRFTMYQNQGMAPEQALQMVENDVNNSFPNVNPNRNNPAQAEGAAGPRGKRSSGGAVTMDQLSNDETALWRNGGKTMFGSEKDFLKAVANSRKEG